MILLEFAQKFLLKIRHFSYVKVSKFNVIIISSLKEGMRSLYSIGQMVVYGVHGVCSIIDIQSMKVDRKNVEYYVLEPIDQAGARYYIPSKNEHALSKLCPILNKEQLDKLLADTNVADDSWISDENQRKQHYRELINSGDRAALLCMIRCLYKHKAEQLAAGRKFHLCDEIFLRDAEKLLSTEFALVLNIKPDEVGNYIQNVLNSLC